jgi:hypothetical protein
VGATPVPTKDVSGQSVPESWRGDWQAFLQAFQASQQKLLNEVTSAWRDVVALLDLVGEAYSTWQSRSWQPDSFSAMDAKLRDAGQDLLRAPLDLAQKKRPVRRVLSAIEESSFTLEDLVRPLPASLPCSNKDFLSAVGLASAQSIQDFLTGWPSLKTGLPLRRLVADHLHREAWRRSRLDDSFLLPLKAVCSSKQWLTRGLFLSNAPQ